MIEISAQFRLPKPLAEGAEPPFGADGIKKEASSDWARARNEATAPVEKFYDAWRGTFLAASAITRYGLAVHTEFNSDQGNVDIYPGTSSLKPREALRLLLDEDGLSEGWETAIGCTVPLDDRRMEAVALIKKGSEINLIVRSWQTNDAATGEVSP